MIESFVSDVKQSPLFLSSLLVIWLDCPGEGEWLINGFTSRLSGKGLTINCVCFSVPASSFNAFKTKQDNNYLAGLSSLRADDN